MSNRIPTNSLASSSAQHTSQPQPTPSTSQQQIPDDPLYGPLDKASKTVDERLARDERWIGVGDCLGGEHPQPAQGPTR